MALLRLTDITQAQSTALTPTTLIHIVTTADTVQYSGGSSYKASISQVFDSLSGYTAQTINVNNLNVFSVGSNPSVSNLGIDINGNIVYGNDVFTTGFSISDNVFTISDNSGNTLTQVLNTLTGLTVNGSLSATTLSASTIDLCGSNGTLYTDSISGCSPINFLSQSNFVSGLTATTVSATTYENLPVSAVTSTGNGVTLINSYIDGNVSLKSITGSSRDTISAVTVSDTIQLDVNEQNLTLWNLVVQGNRLLSGGASYFSGLTYQMTPLEYIIDGVIYNIPNDTTVTLASGDTLDRIDVIVANITGGTSVVIGIPSLNPEKPNIDESSEVEVTFVLVSASATSITEDSFIIYNENTGSPSEWTFSKFGNQQSLISSSYTGQSFSGLTSISISGLTNPPSSGFTSYFRLSGSTSVDTNQYSSLQFAIKNTVANATNSAVRFRFLDSNGNQNGTIIYMNAAGSAGYVQYSSTNVSSWQLISIPLWRFYLTNTSVQVLEFAFSLRAIAGNKINQLYDTIKLVGGNPTNPPTNSWTTIRGDASTPTIIAPNPNATLIISGGTNIGSTITAPNRVNLNLDNYIYLSGVTASTDSSFNGVNIGRGNNPVATNLIIGKNTLTVNSGTYNLAIGEDSMSVNTTGGFNTGIGYRTLYSNVGGGSNIAIGAQSEYFGVNGSDNIAIGVNSLVYNPNGGSNIALGNYSQYGQASVNSNSNLSIGHYSLYSIGNGQRNISIGNDSQYFASSSNDNLSIGLQSMKNTTTSNNLAIGNYSLSGNTVGVENVSVGKSSLKSNISGNYNTSVGYESLYTNTAGTLNTSFGYQSLYFSNGINNTSVGSYSLYNNTTGNYNTSLGYNSLYDNSTGSDNTAIGSGAGITNVTGGGLTLIGVAADVQVDGLTNATAIGYNTQVGASNSLILGNNANVGIGTATPSSKLEVVGTIKSSTISATTYQNLPTEIQVAASDETTALTTGTAKVTFRMPYAMTVTEVRGSLTTAQASGNIFTVDINESGISILSTKLTIDNTEKTSVTAATPPVISDTSLADDAEITVDIDQIGDGTATGLKITIKGFRA